MRWRRVRSLSLRCAVALRALRLQTSRCLQAGIIWVAAVVAMALQAAQQILAVQQMQAVRD